MDTIQEEKLRIDREKYQGTICRCCGTPAVVHNRSLTKGMAKILLAMYHLHRFNPKPHHINDIAAHMGRNIGGGDLAKLNYWGLATQIKERSGEWFISKGGIEFVEGEVKISKIAQVYKGEVVRFTNDFVTFEDCIK